MKISDIVGPVLAENATAVPMGHDVDRRIFILGFTIFWMALGIGFYVRTQNAGNAQAKRAAHRDGVIVMGVVFWLILLIGVGQNLAHRPAATVALLLVAIPVIALCSWLNIRIFKFCPKCGKTTIDRMSCGRMRDCPYCGSSFVSPPK